MGDEYLSIEKSKNVKLLLKKYRDDPLFPFIGKLQGYHSLKVMEDDISMYQLSYAWYYLSLERFLPEMSLAIKWFNGPYWALKSRQKYTASERRIADQYNAISRFLRLDFYNTLLYSRILFDRIAALSRFFLRQGNKPSFTSFNDHKKFFTKLKSSYGDHDEYATYIRENTSWFDTPLKEARDHFIVHSSPRHMRNFGYGFKEYEFALFISVPPNPKSLSEDNSTKHIAVSVPKLAGEIHKFLTWFNDYALRKTDFDFHVKREQ